MRVRPAHVLMLSLCLHPACGQPLEDEPEEGPALAITRGAQDDVPLPDPAPAPDSATDPAAAPADDPEPSDTLAWPLVALKIDVAADAIDAIAAQGDALTFAGRRKENGVILRLAGDAKQATTTLSAEKDLGAVGPITLFATKESTLAAWHDSLGVGWSLTVDDKLGAQPKMILDPELDGQGRGAIALAHDDDGTLACTGVKEGPLRCTLLDATGAGQGWMIVGKTNDMEAEALVPSPRGFLLLASACRPKDGGCKRKDLAVVRLDHDAQTKKKVPPLSLPQVETRRGGLIVVPTSYGFILVARRVGAGETTAWKVDDQGSRELDGKWTRVVGGLESDSGVAFVESAPIAMRAGFPVATFRLRELEDNKRGDALGWPSAIVRQLPNTVDQRVVAGNDLWTFIEPIRKGHVKGTVVRVGRVL